MAGILWIIERIAFFTLIRDKGAVYTIQAVYVSTPAAVLFAIFFYGGGADIWLWISLSNSDAGALAQQFRLIGQARQLPHSRPS